MSSRPLPQRKTERLRIARISRSGQCYFITFCTSQRRSLLNTPEAFDACIQAADAITKSLNWDLKMQTVMPDHIHQLFTLGDSLLLRQLVGKYKTLLKREMGITFPLWQENFHDRRIRDEAEFQSTGFYMFMNPYVKKLLSVREVWKGHLIPDPKVFPFLSKRIEGMYPEPRWLSGD